VSKRKIPDSAGNRNLIVQRVDGHYSYCLELSKLIGSTFTLTDFIS
jgi:hypothetical protein